jgi:hypothetical protein
MRLPRLPRRLQLVGLLAAMAGVLVLAGPTGVDAQSSPATAPLSVSVTVVRSATVEAVEARSLPGQTSPTGQPAPSPGPTYTLRYGKDTLSYPVQPGPTPTLVGAGVSPATVTRSSDGRKVVIQF